MEAITKKMHYAKFKIVAKHKNKREYIGKALEKLRDDTLEKGRYYLLQYRGAAHQPYVVRRVNKPTGTSDWILIK